jgi:hypothetical protein
MPRHSWTVKLPPGPHDRNVPAKVFHRVGVHEGPLWFLLLLLRAAFFDHLISRQFLNRATAGR